MKRRILSLLLVSIFVCGLAATGCGKNSGESQEELLGWLKEGENQFNKETYSAIVSNIVSIYEDSSEEEEKSEMMKVIDKKNQIAMQKMKEPEYESITFMTKEDGLLYTYDTGFRSSTAQEEPQNISLKIKESKEDTQEGILTYEDEKKGVNLSYEGTKDYEISNLKVTNEGTEKIDGAEAVKIKVAYEVIYLQEEETLTRESVLAEYEWTEEDITLVEEVSAAADAYVAEKNAQLTPLNETDKIEEYIWLSSKGHRIIQGNSIIQGDESKKQEISTQAQDAFYKMAWRVGYVKQAMAYGSTKEEALEQMKTNISFIEEMETEDVQEPTLPTVKEVVWTTTYITGKDAASLMEERPKVEKEITREQYNSGQY